MANWVRVRHDGAPRIGQRRGDTIELFEGDLFDAPRATGERIGVEGATWLPPVHPWQFLGLWNNFHERRLADGLFVPRSPLYFAKLPGCVAAHGEPVRRPPGFTGAVKLEAELGIVIGRPCFQVMLDEVDHHILGYTCVNDLTAPGPLFEESGFVHWTRAKSFPGFGPLGPGIETGVDPDSLSVRARVDGRLVQDYPVSDMIFGPREIVSLISREVQLLPGDVIACGTSTGACTLAAGERVSVEIEGVGVLENPFLG
jgi:2-keto-4-pentenoate hydratase/2-oxohepta-3-ene-1,7-dioic acid hydratase in catechol pathway